MYAGGGWSTKGFLRLQDAEASDDKTWAIVDQLRAVGDSELTHRGKQLWISRAKSQASMGRAIKHGEAWEVVKQLLLGRTILADPRQRKIREGATVVAKAPYGSDEYVYNTEWLATMGVTSRDVERVLAKVREKRAWL